MVEASANKSANQTADAMLHFLRSGGSPALQGISGATGMNEAPLWADFFGVESHNQSQQQLPPIRLSDNCFASHEHELGRQRRRGSSETLVAVACYRD